MSCVSYKLQKSVRLLGAGVSIAAFAMLASCAKPPKPVYVSLDHQNTGSIQSTASSGNENTSQSSLSTGNQKAFFGFLKSKPDSSQYEKLPAPPFTGSIGTPDDNPFNGQSPSNEALFAAKPIEAIIPPTIGNAPNIAPQSVQPTNIESEKKKSKSLFGWLFGDKNKAVTNKDKSSAQASKSQFGTIDRMTTTSSSNDDEGGPILALDSAMGNEDKKGLLTLRQVVGQTLETNPEVGIASAKERDAAAGVRVARANYMPQVDLEVSTGAENTYTEAGKAEGVHRTDANIQLSQTIYDFGSTKARVNRRNKLLESAQLRRQDKSEEIAFKVVEAYLEVLKQSDLAAAAARNVTAHEKMSDLVVLTEKEGNGTLADVKRVQTRLDAAKSAVLDIDNGLQAAIGAFKRITDIDPKQLKRPKSISAKLGRIKSDEFNQVAKNNPTMRALLADQESLREQYKQQTGKRYPELFVSTQANYKDNNGGRTGTNMDVRGMVGFRIKLFDGGTRAATEDQIDARVEEAGLNYQKTYRELIQVLDDNAQAIKSADEKAKFLSDTVSAARKVVSLYTEQFKVDEKSPFELLDAQLDLYNAERDLITNKFDAANATFNNLRLRGGLIQYLETQ